MRSEPRCEKLWREKWYRCSSQFFCGIQASFWAQTYIDVLTNASILVKIFLLRIITSFSIVVIFRYWFRFCWSLKDGKTSLQIGLCRWIVSNGIYLRVVQPYAVVGVTLKTVCSLTITPTTTLWLPALILGASLRIIAINHFRLLVWQFIFC